MPTQVNTTTNTVTLQNLNQIITVVDNNNGNNVNVTQPLVNVIEVAIPGTIGPIGPQGPSGSFPSTGSFATTGSNNFIGDQTITGSLSITGSLAVASSVVGGITIPISPPNNFYPTLTIASTAFEGFQSSGNLISISNTGYMLQFGSTTGQMLLS